MSSVRVCVDLRFRLGGRMGGRCGVVMELKSFGVGGAVRSSIATAVICRSLAMYASDYSFSGMDFLGTQDIQGKAE